MGKTNYFWITISQNYTALSATENPHSKLIKYACNYCLHRYAWNVTRMAGHLLTDCKKCPQAIKDLINQAHRHQTSIKAQSGTSTSKSQPKNNPIEEPSIMTRKVNARWTHVSKHYSKLSPEESQGGKTDKYMCIYCSQRYACNVTRMAQHILDCEMCPSAIRNEFYDSSALTQTTDSFAFQSCGSEFSEDSNSLLMQTNLFDAAPIETTSNSFSESFVHKIEVDDSNNAESDENVEDTSKSCSETINTTTKEEQGTWALLARACYATGTSVNIFQNEHWQKVFQEISPDVKLPTPQLLSQDYLNDEYASIRNEVEEKIKQARTLGLQIHGLQDKKYESAIIIIFTTPEPVVYKVVDAKTARRNPNYLTDIISNIMNDNVVNRILSIVTDNEKISWKALESKVPNSPVSCYACNLHILNLLILDILNLPTFKNILSICTATVKEIKTRPNIVPMFFETGDEETDIVFPSKKHWEKTQLCINSFIKNKNLLLSLAETTEYLIKNKSSILDDIQFWPNVLLLHDLLKYLDSWVKRMKIECPCISSVVQNYFDLNIKFKETFSNLNVAEEQSTEILKCLANHQKFAVKDIHKAASLLNPYFMGKNLSDEDIIDAIAFINNLSKTLPEVKSEKIMFDIAAYRTKQGIWAKDFVWHSLTTNGEKLPPIIWWQSMCASTELSKIAGAVLSCSPTLTGKLFNFDGRKRCKNEKVQKLVYIRHNLKLLGTKENKMETEDCYTHYSTDSDSDSSSDSDNF